MARIGETRVGETRLGAGILKAFLVAVLVFMAAPIVIVVINSFNASPFNQWPPTGLTLSWYARALGYAPFQRGVINSLWTGALSTALVLALGAPLAYALARLRFEGQAALRAVLFGPLVVPRVAIGFALFVLLLATRSGLYGTMAGIVLGHGVLMLPFVVAILVANLGEVDPALEEAARDLGAGPIQAFRLAVLPQMRPGLLVASLFAFITSFDEVETSIFLARPAVNTLPIEMYLYLDQYQDPTLAAVSTILIALSLVVVLIGAVFVRGRTLLRFAGGRAP
jgi:putative spermidine/putrescine transport system permease protein